jgi:hypothetical protein
MYSSERQNSERNYGIAVWDKSASQYHPYQRTGLTLRDAYGLACEFQKNNEPPMIIGDNLERMISLEEAEALLRNVRLPSKKQ